MAALDIVKWGAGMIDTIFSNRRQPSNENRCPDETKAVGYIEGFYGKWKPLCLSTLHVEDMEDVVIIIDQVIIMVMIIATAALVFKLWQWLRGSLKIITIQTKERPDLSTHIIAEMHDMLRELRDHGRMLSGIGQHLERQARSFESCLYYATMANGSGRPAPPPPMSTSLWMGIDQPTSLLPQANHAAHRTSAPTPALPAPPQATPRPQPGDENENDGADGGAIARPRPRPQQ